MAAAHRQAPEAGRPRDAASVRHRLAAAGSLTPAEQLVADYYEDGLPGVALADLRRVCEATGVSTATVARFARKLGYADFRDLSRALHREARADLDRPRDRLARASADGAAGAEATAPTPAPRRRFEIAVHELHATLDGLDVEVFDRVAALVGDAGRPLYLGAVASGRPLLDHFGLLLSYVRGQVTVLPGTDQWAHVLAGMTADSVVLASAFDRHPLAVHGLLRFARRRGATTALITNRRTSPLVRDADHALFVSSRGEDVMFRTRAPLLVLFEALLDTVAPTAPEAGTRARDVEELFDALGGYVPS